MPSEPLRLDPELLLAESSWLRSLARGLLSDRATADDIVQDTWVAALERPPSPRKLRAWLAAVVCNSARLQLRARARRTSREQRFASRERLPSTDEIVQHEAERRRVVGIVLAIAEPHRSTLLLRYWCDLSPGAIAERLGIPHSTVRNRLKRALEQVRTRLDRESGGMQRAVRVLLALPVPAIGTFAGPSATASIGVLAMSAKLKMAWACLVLAVAGGFTWMLASRPDRNARPAATTARHELPPPPSPAQEQRADVPARAAVDGTGVAAAASIVVSGSVVGLSGQPIAAALRFTGDHGEDRDVRDDGHGFAIAGLAPGEWRITCRATGYRRMARTVRLARARERVDFQLEPTLTLGVRFVTPDERPLAEQVDASSPPFRRLLLHSLTAIATEAAPLARVLDLDWNLRRTGVGEYRGSRNASNVPPGCDGVLEISAALPVYVSALIGDTLLDTQVLDRPHHDVTFVVAREQIDSRAATLRLRVAESETGHMVTSATFALASGASVTTCRAAPSADGTIELTSLPPGLLPFSIIVDDRASLTRFVRLAPGGILDLGTIELPRRIEIQGRVVGPDGEALTDCGGLLLREIDSMLSDEPLSVPFRFCECADGTFTASIAPKRCFLLATAPAMGPAAALIDASSGSTPEIAIALRPSSRVTLDHELRSGTSVRILNADDLPLWFERVYDVEPLHAELSPGCYRVEAYQGGALVLSRSFEVGEQPIVVRLGW